jgi:LacI family transcriptional regulator
MTGPARSGFVGLLVPLVNDPYFSPIVSGAVEAAYEQELRLVVATTLHEHAREVSLLDGMRGATDGNVIILPEQSSHELLKHPHPVVVADPLFPLDERVPSVAVANRSGADQVMRYLLALGHRRIAAICGPPGWIATEDRRRGYEAALAAAGIPLDPAVQTASDFELAPGAEAAASLLELPEPPTAIFAFNDAIAIGALRAARDRGLRVPEDLSVLGFDDIEHAAIVTPPLTTVRQPLAEMGRAAISLLSRLLDSGPDERLHVELPTRLVVRDSTAPPRAG